MPTINHKAGLTFYDLDENSTLEVSESVWNSYQAALSRFIKATEHLEKNIGEVNDRSKDYM